jgi:tetratricopeptide (TPR) repeat protein
LVLLVRYHGELRYMFQEFWRSKGIVLPLSLLVTVLLLIWKPSGLVLFVPFLCWPVMARGERHVYTALAVLMALVPLFLPLSMEVNYSLLQAYEALQSGDLSAAEKLLESGRGDADDFTRTYMGSLIALRRGDAEEAGKALERLAKMDTESDGVAVNRGVLAARNGDYEAAEKYFLQAIAKEASNPRALFNLSSLHAIRGDEDKTAQYRRWADTAASGELPIDELIHLPEEVSRLPLVDQPLPPRSLEPYFDFYSSTNFLAFHGEMLLFLGWLLAGGGLCGLLVFARERMDVDFNEYRKSNNDMASLKDRAWNQARLLNMVAPGLGMTFVGSPYLGTFLYLLVMTPVILWWSGGGFLANSVFPGISEGPVPLVLALGLVAATVLYLLAQYLLWRRARDVEAR